MSIVETLPEWIAECGKCHRTVRTSEIVECVYCGAVLCTDCWPDTYKPTDGNPSCPQCDSGEGA